eukprot:152978-Prymnesium_polylepis.1
MGGFDGAAHLQHRLQEALLHAAPDPQVHGGRVFDQVGTVVIELLQHERQRRGQRRAGGVGGGLADIVAEGVQREEARVDERDRAADREAARVRHERRALVDAHLPH